MRSYKETKTIQYDASLLYSIIMDVENYPNFLPWCSYATILSKNEDYLEAELNITFKGVSESYVSRVFGVEDGSSYKIEVVGISGPFKFLKNNWVIESVNNGSEVKFSIDFELKSRILDMVVGVFFSTITEKMVAAFEDRAKELSV
ncbi:MAG: type II toxin-antitoxin system RatA family toxin [Rickettsiaceae bacterium]|nr:type II toxin-antitoxin system RatA family toxin [Rickettsiaceae bacterium]